ncbi:hypothetical protein KEM52_002999, partial [Ascosphaera acerosa]
MAQGQAMNPLLRQQLQNQNNPQLLQANAGQQQPNMLVNPRGMTPQQQQMLQMENIRRMTAAAASSQMPANPGAMLAGPTGINPIRGLSRSQLNAEISQMQLSAEESAVAFQAGERDYQQFMQSATPQEIAAARQVAERAAPALAKRATVQGQDPLLDYYKVRTHWNSKLAKWGEAK